MPLTRSQAQFINWLKIHEPFLYQIAVKRAAMEGQTLHGLGSWFDSVVNSVTTALPKITSTVAKVAPQYYQYRVQRSQAKAAEKAAKEPPPVVIQEQAQRAQQGLPPMPVYNYQPLLSAPPPAAAQQLANKAAKDSKQTETTAWLLPAGLVAAALIARG